MLYQETPSGTIDGGTVFSLSFTPVANTSQYFINGLLQKEGTHYSISGQTLTVFSALAAGDWHTICYETVGVSATGMLVSQIGDIAQWACVDVLNRTDMLPQARKFAKDVYNLICTNIPFDELQTTSAERAMTIGTSSYDISDLDVAGIVSVRLTISSNNYRRLRRSHTRLYDGLTSIRNSIPASYARWAKSLEFFPPPQLSSYTYRLRYWRRPSFTPTFEDTAIITPPEWDELYKWETLYRLYYALERFSEAASLVMVTPMPRQAEPKRRIQQEVGIIPRLWNELLKTVSQRENIDEDFGINPLIRPYTAGRHA